MTISISNVATTDTFQSWLTKTNQIADALSTTVVTVAANTIGGQNSSNLYLNGVLSANTVAAVEGLRGGTVDQSANLTITSNTHFQSPTGTSNLSSNTTYLNLKATTATVNATTLTINGTTMTVSSNLNVLSNTISVTSAGRLGVNTSSAAAALDVVGTVNMGGGTIALSGNVSITANTTVSSNIALTGALANVTGNMVVGGNTSVGANLVVTNDISGNTAAFSNTVTLTGALGANSITANTLGLSVALPIASGGTGSASAAGARTNLGLGSIATLNTITSSQFTGTTSLSILDSAGSTLKTLYASST